MSGIGKCQRSNIIAHFKNNPIIVIIEYTFAGILREIYLKNYENISKTINIG